jgi:flagellar hook-associated protein 1 FlgK
VNAAIQKQPSLLRDGTHAVGNPGDPNYFAPNPPNGPAGFTTMISRVLNYTFGSASPGGVSWPSNTNQLGPSGTLSAPYTAPATLSAIASTVLASQAQESAATNNQSDTEQSVQTMLAGKLSAQSGVNMDAEMSHMIQLQNAYAANARIISTLQAMWSQLLEAVR